MGEMIPQEVVEQKIFVIRGHKDMLDKDLAVLSDRGRIQKLDVPFWNIKLGRYTQDAQSFYRTRDSYAFFSSQE